MTAPMFRQRTSSHKPGDNLLANFRQQFPQVAVAASSLSAGPASTTTAAASATFQERSRCVSHEQFWDQDPTPRASNEPWRFAPPLVDSCSSFVNFTNQPPRFYMPTPGGTNTIYRHQAGNLHTPTPAFGMGLGTPLLVPTGDGALLSGVAPMNASQFQHFQTLDPFIQHLLPQPAPAPSSFVHQDTGYETMGQDGSSTDSDTALNKRVGSIDTTIHTQSPLIGSPARQLGMPIVVQDAASGDQFRFYTTLNAPTAMTKHAEEIPMTYLNKGQAYSLAVVDTNPTLAVAPGTRFRTLVRITFEDDQQRQKPGLCWRLWQEGRGTSESYQRGGRLQIVEFIESGQAAEGDSAETRVELESASFDGFCVTWTPGLDFIVKCNIAVRFNFLSTDFSHSKGVKGIPVRLCVKTQPIVPDPASPDVAAEICYCKIKLFRDHGAERKLCNDVAHVKKMIEKLKQQIEQAESGVKESGKRKKSMAGLKELDSQQPGKTQRHKRTWSMSSASSAGNGGSRLLLEEDLHVRLQTLQDMFTSTRPVSVLFLRGDEHDVPDLHQVFLPGLGDYLDLSKIDFREGAAWRSERSSMAGSFLASPSPSLLSLHSQAPVSGANLPRQDLQRVGSGEPSVSWHGLDQPTKIKQTLDQAGNFTCWIEALGVDPNYRPFLMSMVRPVACFYVARKDTGSLTPPVYHRAVYLMQRSLKDFVTRLAAKWGFDMAKVHRVVHVLQRGLEVVMDDDVIRELAEGQDMILELVEAHASTLPLKQGWEMTVDLQGKTDTATKLELRLSF